MPERSKGLDSSSSSFDCVGSNPTECNFFVKTRKHERNLQTDELTDSVFTPAVG
jgi:hypothetical protein